MKMNLKSLKRIKSNWVKSGKEVTMPNNVEMTVEVVGEKKQVILMR